MVSSIQWEWELLLHAIRLGIEFAVIYDALRIFRTILTHHNFFVSLEDLVFWIYCTAAIFQMQFNQSNGVSRGFSILGITAGMLLYHKLIGERLISLAEKLIYFLKRQLTGIKKVFKMKLCKHSNDSTHNESKSEM